jgi:hypothetical protein
MKLNQKRRTNYANEQTNQGLRQWLIIAAFVASIILIFIGIRLIFR